MRVFSSFSEEGSTLSVESGRRDWVAQAEAALTRLRDIEYATITTDGEQIQEVHIVARTSRKPKQIARDVESALNAYLKRRIDHRVISVVVEREDAAPTNASPAKAQPRPAVEGVPPASERPREPAASEAPSMRESFERAAPRLRAAEAQATGTRVRFASANVYVAGLRTQAQVELQWRGMLRLGSATGPSTRENAERLVASATLNALQPFLGEERTLAVQDVARLRVGRQTVYVVSVKLLEHRNEKVLTGSCTLEQDVPQTVVFATLAAVNRILGGLPAQEPVEYELRPTST
jgi:hypothetical protein